MRSRLNSPHALAALAGLRAFRRLAGEKVETRRMVARMVRRAYIAGVELDSKRRKARKEEAGRG